jgi:hypothetical protein
MQYTKAGKFYFLSHFFGHFCTDVPYCILLKLSQSTASAELLSFHTLPEVIAAKCGTVVANQTDPNSTTELCVYMYIC